MAYKGFAVTTIVSNVVLGSESALFCDSAAVADTDTKSNDNTERQSGDNRK